MLPTLGVEAIQSISRLAAAIHSLVNFLLCVNVLEM